MGGYARATYPGGGFRTEVGGGPGYGGRLGGGMGGMPPWFQQAMESRIAQQEAQSAAELEAQELQNQFLRWQMGEARREAQRARAPRMATYRSPEALAQRGLEAQTLMGETAARAAAAQHQAAMRPAPTRTMFGFNVIPGQTLDPMAMSAYQRQLFLPQQAGGMDVPTPMEAGRMQYEMGRGQQRAEMAGIADLRSWMAGAVPGFSGQPFGGFAGPESDPARATQRAYERSPGLHEQFGGGYGQTQQGYYLGGGNQARTRGRGAGGAGGGAGGGIAAGGYQAGAGQGLF